MSQLSANNHNSADKYLIVFDTPALLSANAQNPESDWVKYQQLGDCYVPQATLTELQEFARKGHRKAKKFLRFIEEWKSYTILEGGRTQTSPILDNVKSKSKHILDCTFHLAKKWNDYIVVLVTYESLVEVLTNQEQVAAQLPNLCALPVGTLTWWSQQGVATQQVPQPVSYVLQRLSSLPKFKRQKVAALATSVPQSAQKQYALPVVPVTPVLLPPDTPKPVRQIFLSPMRFMGWGAALAAFVVIPISMRTLSKHSPGIFNFVKEVKTTLANPSQQGESNIRYQRLREEQLVREAKNAILMFQSTQEAEVLKKALDNLEQLRQRGQLERQGRQSLSKLKHKYAIEVLATSGQLAEAATMLKEIPENYGEIEQIKAWLDNNAQK